MKRSGIFSCTSLIAVLTMALPQIASAQTFVQMVELFNIFVGLMLAVALLVFLGGLGSYLSRFSTWPSHRDQSIKVMEWGVAILFVLIVILGIVQYFEKYPKVTSTILAVIILLIIARAVINASNSKEAKKEH